MFERFTDRSHRVLALAQQEAHRQNHDHVGTEHLLLGLVDDKQDSPAEILASLSVSPGDVRERVLEVTPVGQESANESTHFTAELKKTLELSLRESLHLRSSSIGTNHLLIGLLRNGESTGTKVLADLVGDLNLVRLELLEKMSWYTGRVVEEEGVKKPVMEYPDIRPLPGTQTGQSHPRPIKRRPRDEPTTPEWEPIRPPDFRQLVSDGM